MKSYQDRYCDVLDYIASNLEEDLTVEHLSRIAYLSKYHFHRQFSALLGIGVSSYIKQLRLRKAAYQLAFRVETKVIDIALSNGYESSEAFSRAFKQFTGQSPSSFRKDPDGFPWQETNPLLKTLRNFKMNHINQMYVVKLIEFPETKIAAIEHKGPPATLSNTIRQFIAWRKENHLPPAVSRTFNLHYADPDTVSPEDFHMDIGASVKADISANDYGVVNKTINGGRCAVIRHVGSDGNIRAAITYLYSDWLNQSGEELRDAPLFFERVKFFPDVPEHQVITDIYLPLA